MEFLFDRLDSAARYKLISSLVVPRPIALVTSIGADGVTNAAPFSFFNVFSEEPPLCMLGIADRPEGSHKDTVHNITTTRQFVVNLVDEDLAAAMNICAIDFPPGVSELDAAGLTLAPSSTVAPGRVAEAPAALECKLTMIFNPGYRHRLVLGEITAVHTRPGIVDPATLRIDLEAYRPVGRLFANLYTRTADRFELVRQTYAQWKSGR